MCPGRYPSETPSRESTPAEPIERCPDVGAVRATTPDRPPLRNYTASNLNRQEPKFAASQSEPNLLLGHENRTPSPIISPPSRLAPVKGRRASDLFRNPPRKQTEGNGVRKQDHSRRAVSGPAIPTFMHGISSVQTPTRDSFGGIDPTPTNATSSRPSSSTSTPSAHSAASSPDTSSIPSPSRPPTPPSPSPSAEDCPSDIIPEFLVTPHAINQAIHAKLCQRLTQKDGKGTIYILRDTDRPERGIKIGITQRDNDTGRFKEHWRKCGYVPKIIDVIENVTYCKRTESLINVDLRDRRQKLHCARHKGNHNEWFNITEDEAKQTVMKWVTFMEDQQPYDMWRQLSPFWQYILSQRPSPQPKSSTNALHNARREQWTQVLSKPTRLEELYYNLHTLGQYWQFSTTSIRRISSSCVQAFWQIMALIGWFIVLVILQSTFAATVFAFVLVCAWISMVPNGVPKKRKAKK